VRVVGQLEINNDGRATLCLLLIEVFVLLCRCIRVERHTFFGDDFAATMNIIFKTVKLFIVNVFVFKL